MGTKSKSSGAGMAGRLLKGIGAVDLGTSIAGGIVSAHEASGVGDYPKGKVNTDSQGKSTVIKMGKKAPASPQSRPVPQKKPQNTPTPQRKPAPQPTKKSTAPKKAKEVTPRGRQYNIKLKK